MNTVYKITCSVNQKVYIGVTTQSPPEKRWIAHLHYDKKHYRDKLLFRAFIKHGKEKFTFTILEQTNCIDALKELEIKYIKEYNAYCNWPNGGYNMTFGGDGVWGLKHSDEAKRKMSDIKKEQIKEGTFSIPSFKGCAHTEETKKKQSASHIGLIAGSKHYLYGKAMPESQREAIGNANRGIKKPEGFGEQVANRESLKWKVTFPDGHTETITNLRKFCRDNKLSAENLWKTSKNIISQSQGFSCKKMK